MERCQHWVQYTQSRNRLRFAVNRIPCTRKCIKSIPDNNSLRCHTPPPPNPWGRGIEIKDVSIPSFRWRHLLIYAFLHKFLNEMPATRRSKISKEASHLLSYNTTLIFKSLGFNSTQYEKHFFLFSTVISTEFSFIVIYLFFFLIP